MGTVPFLEGTNCSEQGQMQQRNQAPISLLMFQASGTCNSDRTSAGLFSIPSTDRELPHDHIMVPRVNIYGWMSVVSDAHVRSQRAIQNSAGYSMGRLWRQVPPGGAGDGMDTDFTRAGFGQRTWNLLLSVKIAPLQWNPFSVFMPQNRRDYREEVQSSKPLPHRLNFQPTNLQLPIFIMSYLAYESKQTSPGSSGAHSPPLCPCESYRSLPPLFGF